jgi:hypothetical protein
MVSVELRFNELKNARGFKEGFAISGFVPELYQSKSKTKLWYKLIGILERFYPQ